MLGIFNVPSLPRQHQKTYLTSLPSEDPHAARVCRESNPDLLFSSPVRYLYATATDNCSSNNQSLFWGRWDFAINCGDRNVKDRLKSSLGSSLVDWDSYQTYEPPRVLHSILEDDILQLPLSIFSDITPNCVVVTELNWIVLPYSAFDPIARYLHKTFSMDMI